ncbi:DUF551 domain-containing protein [Escherichia coli]|nr:DUF551 domain-containing protein [Escherichia coli]EGI3956941.1 DUF551 domain-containing protein [Escherichia coli]EGI3971305.1 DUF551 domain-containing protein [Escherichia coli]
MKFSKFSELVNRILLNRILSNNHSHRRDMDVTIVVHSPGSIGSTPSVEVQSIHAGFDWDSGKVLIFPSQPLTTLTPEQITDITDSVRKGQSWHAYQEYKNHKEQLEKLSIELESAKNHIAELEAKPVSQTYNLPELIEGMEVSIDVSTCDADLGNRYFGTVTEALELDTAKNGYILLVQDAEPNFDVNGNSPVTPDGWISCSERMPDDGQHVIILCDGAFVLYAQYRDGEFFDIVRNGEEFFETQSRNVTHWMPLPEPPQEVNRG